MSAIDKIKHSLISNDPEIVKITDRMLEDENVTKHTFNTVESAVARSVLRSIVEGEIENSPEGCYNFIVEFLYHLDNYSCSVEGRRSEQIMGFVSKYEFNQLKKMQRDNAEKDKLNIDE